MTSRDNENKDIRNGEIINSLTKTGTKTKNVPKSATKVNAENTEHGTKSIGELAQ